ncbi:MAG: hypothetical protein ISQ08_06285 [Planctomycetes bacterium]|nr:hypothetical protein [Planctomycetota bacterium]MDA0948522.1 hypothetical protein [Planctomycetota bacterium]
MALPRLAPHSLAALLVLTACASSPRGARIEDESKPSLLMDRVGGVRSLAWVPEDRALMLSTERSGLLRWHSGSVPTRCAPVAPLALAAGPDGLVGADQVHARIARFSASGERGAVLAASFRGEGLAEARSLASHASGALCIVDRSGQLLSLSPAGELRAVPLEHRVHCAEVHGEQLLLAVEGEGLLLLADLDATGVPTGTVRPLRSMDAPVLALAAAEGGCLLAGSDGLLQLLDGGGAELARWRMPAPVVSVEVPPGERLAYIATEEQVYRLLLPDLARAGG